MHDFKFQIDINFKLKGKHIQINEIKPMSIALGAFDVSKSYKMQYC